MNVPGGENFVDAHVSGAGDPARTLQLLWRIPDDRPSRRGPRQGLSIDQIVEAATAAADAEGLDAVTMRRVARDLGVATMTLYTYVPGKAELLDLMLDFAYANMPRTQNTSTHWRSRVNAVASDNRALFAAHPWAVTISTARPPLGPGSLAKYERELAAFDGTGLDDIQTDSALTFVLQFVRMSALNAMEVESTQVVSDLNDEDWWAANAPLLDRIVDAESFPRATRVGAAVGMEFGAAFDAEHAYDFGLRRILDGLAELVKTT